MLIAKIRQLEQISHNCRIYNIDIQNKKQSGKFYEPLSQLNSAKFKNCDQELEMRSWYLYCHDIFVLLHWCHNAILMVYTQRLNVFNNDTEKIVMSSAMLL